MKNVTFECGCTQAEWSHDDNVTFPATLCDAHQELEDSWREEMRLIILDAKDNPQDYSCAPDDDWLDDLPF